jgi:hypothetical protein
VSHFGRAGSHILFYLWGKNIRTEEIVWSLFVLIESGRILTWV